MIKLANLKKVYKAQKHNEHLVLNDLNLAIKHGESIAIEGRSGSGKTTLLNIITGMDAAFTGTYQFNDINLSQANPATRSKFRQERLGIITQQFDLLDDRNVYANLALAISHQKLSREEKSARVAEVLAYVGLAGYEKKQINRYYSRPLEKI